MAALGSGMLVDTLIPRGLARAQQPDRLATFRAQVGSVPIQTQQLGENLTLLSGPGGNVVVLHGTDGLVVVDTFASPAWAKLDAALKALGGPVKSVINTHWHLDHTDNNAPLRAAGATVIAHENTRRRMKERHHLNVLEIDVPPSPANALPQRVFDDGYKLEANGERVVVTHVAPAHTDTDVILRFERANLLHTGDVFFNGRYPYIDSSTGGRIDGMIAAAERVLGLMDSETRIVPGHGRLATTVELEKYRDMLSLAADRIRKLKASGKTLEESIAIKPFADLDAEWGNGRFKGDDFVRIVYSTL
jgi:glyoxylase-like metal-dependent hydrolase (beta-lactamase superfamily II)